LSFLGGVASLGKASKKKIGKLGPMLEKKIIPVEEDANKLVSHVCGSNILKEGVDMQVKPDSEYPEWLWTIRTG
jgi:large subunit ribosomal protein L54